MILLPKQKAILDISRWQTVDWEGKPIPIDWGDDGNC